MARGTQAYAGAARLGRELARTGFTVATGGGPGAMEAANLGAYAAPHPDDMLDQALQLLAKTPMFVPSITDWARTAFEVRDRWPDGGPSVGIPTWPLLQSLARERSMEARIALVDRVEEAPDALKRLGG